MEWARIMFPFDRHTHVFTLLLHYILGNRPVKLFLYELESLAPNSADQQRVDHLITSARVPMLGFLALPINPSATDLPETRVHILG